MLWFVIIIILLIILFLLLVIHPSDFNFKRSNFKSKVKNPKNSLKYANAKNKDIHKVVGDKAAEVIKEVNSESLGIEDLYKNIEEDFKNKLTDVYTKKIDEIEKKLSTQESAVSDSSKLLVSGLQDINKILEAQVRSFENDYQTMLSNARSDISKTIEKVLSKINQSIDSFSKMNMELYNNYLQEVESKTTKTLDDLANQEKEKVSIFSDQLNEDAKKLREDFINSIRRDSALVIVNVIKEVLNITVSLEDQEDYIFDILEKHIDEIRYGL